MDFSKLITLLSGRDLECVDCNSNQEGIPYLIGASNIVDGKINITRWTTKPLVISRYGDILISCKGTIGEIVANEIGDIHIARQFMAIQTLPMIYAEYIELFIRSIVNNIKSNARGVIPGISREDILHREIAFPPLNEQKRIVIEVKRWLDLITDIETRKIELESLIKQTKSKILDIAIQGKLVPQDPTDEPTIELLKRINPNFTPCDNSHYENLPFEIPQSWVWCQFGKYLDVRDGTHDSPKYVEKGYPFVTSKNLNNGKIDFATTKFISEEDHIKFSQRSFVEDGNILFAMIGSIGNPVLVVKDREFSIKNVALFKPYDKRNTYMEYVLYYLLYIQENLKQDAKGGMQPFIPLNYFRNDLFIPIPPLKEQRRIVNTIETIFSHLDIITAEL